jgi:hypothetical protein
LRSAASPTTTHSYLISEDVVELDLIPRSGEIQLVTTEGGLEKLITAGSEALQALRPHQHRRGHQ